MAMDLEAAVAELRRFWQGGRDSVKQTPKYPVGGAAQRMKTTDAEKLGWYPERLRAARLFARRCDEKTLNQVVEIARRFHYSPNWSTVASVFEVPARQRLSLWKRCCENHWSRRQMEAVKRQRHGSLAMVEGGGRTPEINDDADPSIVTVRLTDSMRSLRKLIDAATLVLPGRLNKRLLVLRRKLAEAEESLRQ